VTRMNAAKVAILVTQALFLAVAQAVYSRMRHSLLPIGSRVESINGRRVVRLSFERRHMKRGNAPWAGRFLDRLGEAAPWGSPLIGRPGGNSVESTALRFASLEVRAIRCAAGKFEICATSEAELFSIYGGLRNAADAIEYFCVGDFDTREAAELVVELLGFAARDEPT
jgi:hypothetical protein